MTTPNRQRGLSLLELLVAAAITVVVVGAALPLLAKINTASLRGIPQARRVMTRDTVRAEFLRASDTAAKVAYFDLQGTVAAVRPTLGGGRGSASDTPPEGACLVLAGDPGTWPPGFDSTDRRTWRQVAWWEGADPDDPATWYWICGGARRPSRGAEDGNPGRGTGDGGGRRARELPTGPIDLALQPIVTYGSGVRVGDTLEIVGPLAVRSEDHPVVSGQAGEAVTLLRTDPGFAPLTLGASFQGTSNVIRLVARDAVDVGQIAELLAGDILLVNGRTSAGGYATALATLAAPFHQVAIGSVTDAGGDVIFKFYEAAIEEPGAVYPFGLRNSDLTDEGITIADDAAVALLDRAAPVVTYYTLRVEGGYALHRVVGDPARASDTEHLAGVVAAPLAADIEWESSVAPEGASGGAGSASPSAREPAPEAMRMVKLRVPIAAPEAEREAVEPIEAHVALTGTMGRSPVTLHYRYLGEARTGGSGGRE